MELDFISHIEVSYNICRVLGAVYHPLRHRPETFKRIIDLLYPLPFLLFYIISIINSTGVLKVNSVLTSKKILKHLSNTFRIIVLSMNRRW